MAFDQERYLAKYKHMLAKSKKLTLNESRADSFKINFTPRTLIQAPKGKVLISADYSGQEGMIAAVLSNDPIMLESFLPDSPSSPPTISVPFDYKGLYIGHKYLGKNPKKDMHTLTAQACFPKYFLNKPEYEWVCIARETLVKGKALRDWAKTITYGTIYMQSAQTMSALHNVVLKETQKWVKGFYEKYPTFYNWQQTQAALGLARGWIADGMGKWRWVMETNSKGKDNSGDRLAVNHLIQLVSP